MNEKISSTFYYIFLLCFFSCALLFNKVDSYALIQSQITVEWESSGYDFKDVFSLGISDRNCCLYRVPNSYTFYFLSNVSDPVTNIGYQSFNVTQDRLIGQDTYDWYLTYSDEWDCYYKDIIMSSADASLRASGLYVFSSLQDALNYVGSGITPDDYLSDLELDSFKVTSWQIGNIQAIFQSQFKVEWSDPRISTVQVRIQGTAKNDTFESSSSPFKQKFRASQYVLKNGDVVHLVATPFTSSGSYGTSLYYSFVYNDKIPFSNVYRKFTNTPSNNNTLTIPYNDTSGNNTSYDAPVEYVTTNNNYKVNYNPTTNTYGDFNLYEVYYSPVIYYPTGTPDSEIDQTQDVINNSYTTNNYYETTKNINIDFDVDFGDISGSDIQQGFDDFGNFSNGFGTFIGKLAGWVLALFPFLSPAVAATIVVVFGLILTIAIIAIVLKIAGVIADLIPL